VAHAEELFSADAINTATTRIAAEISSDYPEGVLLVAVLKGSVMFLADLVRAMPGPVSVDFLAISRYAPDSGRVRIVKDLDGDAGGRDIVLVEDIVDTGLTSTFLLRHLASLGPASVALCTLLDRVHRRIVPVDVKYRGFEIDDEFVLGYGLDFAERYRNLRHVMAGDLRGLQTDPDRHVADWYGGSS